MNTKHLTVGEFEKLFPINLDEPKDGELTPAQVFVHLMTDHPDPDTKAKLRELLNGWIEDYFSKQSSISQDTQTRIKQLSIEKKNLEPEVKELEEKLSRKNRDLEGVNRSRKKANREYMKISLKNEISEIEKMLNPKLQRLEIINDFLGTELYPVYVEGITTWLKNL